jgi:hypothetical protein
MSADVKAQALFKRERSVLLAMITLKDSPARCLNIGSLELHAQIDESIEAMELKPVTGVTRRNVNSRRIMLGVCR